jgi:hypothetical protein
MKLTHRDHIESMLTDEIQTIKDIKPKLEKRLGKKIGYSNLLNDMTALVNEGRAIREQIKYEMGKRTSNRGKVDFNRMPRIGWRKQTEEMK